MESVKFDIGVKIIGLLGYGYNAETTFKKRENDDVIIMIKKNGLDTTYIYSISDLIKNDLILLGLWMSL